MLPSDAIEVDYYVQPLHEGYFVGSFGYPKKHHHHTLVTYHESNTLARIVAFNADWRILAMIDWHVGPTEFLADPTRVIMSMLDDPSDMPPNGSFIATAYGRRQSR